MHFAAVRRSGDVVIQAEDLAKSYEPALFQERVFRSNAASGSASWGPTAAAKRRCSGFCSARNSRPPGRAQATSSIRLLRSAAQDAAADKPVIRAVWPGDDPEVNEQAMRDCWADSAWSATRSSAGGSALRRERSRRPWLAWLLLGVNVLVLDEPTNHLDLWACEALSRRSWRSKDDDCGQSRRYS